MLIDNKTHKELTMKKLLLIAALIFGSSTAAHAGITCFGNTSKDTYQMEVNLDKRMLLVDGTEYYHSGATRTKEGLWNMFKNGSNVHYLILLDQKRDIFFGKIVTSTGKAIDVGRCF